MRKLQLLFTIAVMLLGATITAHADVPQLINYQGILKSSGTAVTTSTDVIFAIWDDPAAGDSLWSELQSVTPDADGRFNVLLGSISSIPDSAFASADMYLSVKVDTDPEMSPRQRLASVAYAYRDNDWELIGDILYTQGEYGIARAGNVLYGDNDSTHVNLGIACTTGVIGGAYIYATVGGGYSNVATQAYTTVGGGRDNTARSSGATVGGGASNTASIYYTTVAGGERNTASGSRATVGGGEDNTASGNVATVAGGGSNNARNSFTVVAGGGGFSDADSNSALGYLSAILGGRRNIAPGDSSAVGGGIRNTANGNTSTISGGRSNTTEGHASTVGGGAGNTAGFDAGSNPMHATVGGGLDNQAIHQYATVGGGWNNVASNFGATVPGGYLNLASGLHSFAAGRRAKATHPGTFVWADMTDAPFYSSADNRFHIRATNGIYEEANNTNYGALFDNDGDGDGIRTYASVSKGNVWAALYAINNGTSPAIYASSSGGTAAYLVGDLTVTGDITKGGGGFKIDHPLDPENKYLVHSFVESPERMNVHNGNVITDRNGEAVVQLPEYFTALNRDFRYQLTVIGQFAQVIVSEEINGNQFSIKTDTPSVKVSWQVTGIRQDAFANTHHLQAEVDKPIDERGKYLHPQEHGVPLPLDMNYNEKLNKAQAELEHEK